MGFRVRSLQKGELDELLLCFQDAFHVDDASISVVRNSLVNDPYFHPERVRIGLLDGRIVSHVVILHRVVYVGNQPISVAGITAVATHPAHQRAGLGSRVVEDAIRLIRQQGYELTMLTTQVPRFFSRFGFREVPKFDGYECPATALSRLNVGNDISVQQLDYNRDWRIVQHIYQTFSIGMTGMQVRDRRFWETWPRRGTFPHGFSARLGAMGLLALRDDRPVAYIAAHSTPDQDYLAVRDIAHLPNQEDAALLLLKESAQRFLSAGSGRAVLYLGGSQPLVRSLQDAAVPLTVEIGPGLMVLVPNRDWLKGVGFRNAEDAIEHLFRSDPPILWHRDGY